MNELIERLRNPLWIYTHVSVNARPELDEDQAVDDMKDAAAEIERLLSVCKDKTELLVAAYSQVERMRRILQTLVDNDPSEPIADNGMTVLDGLREDARRLLASGQGTGD